MDYWVIYNKDKKRLVRWKDIQVEQKGLAVFKYAAQAFKCIENRLGGSSNFEVKKKPKKQNKTTR